MICAPFHKIKRSWAWTVNVCKVDFCLTLVYTVSRAGQHCLLNVTRTWAVFLTVGSLSGTGWGWLWCRAWSPPRPTCSRSRHTWGSPRASTYRGPSAGSGPWSSGCSRHSLLAWCPAGRRAFVYLHRDRHSTDTLQTLTQEVAHAFLIVTSS